MTKPAPRPRPLSPGTRAFGPGPLPACPGSPGEAVVLKLEHLLEGTFSNVWRLF